VKPFLAASLTLQHLVSLLLTAAQLARAIIGITTCIICAHKRRIIIILTVVVQNTDLQMQPAGCGSGQSFPIQLASVAKPSAFGGPAQMHTSGVECTLACSHLANQQGGLLRGLIQMADFAFATGRH
jgi:hypothetical protein